MIDIKVKVCCIGSLAEAKMAIAYGATAIGLVGPMPSGPGIIDVELIKEIAAFLPAEIDSFLLTSETKADKIIADHIQTQTNTIQFVDALEEGAYANIRAKLPSVKLVQVIHILDEASIHQSVMAAQYVDHILLDSGNPNKKIKELGGTGRTHDWSLSRKIRDAISIPLYLAGGLKAENIAAAIQTVQPNGVDLCSGVRTDGALDENKLKAFFDAINNY